jgi:hypothetical protein
MASTAFVAAKSRIATAGDVWNTVRTSTVAPSCRNLAATVSR